MDDIESPGWTLERLAGDRSARGYGPLKDEDTEAVLSILEEARTTVAAITVDPQTQPVVTFDPSTESETS